MEAEALGEDWGWWACREREQRALAGAAAGDAVCLQSMSEVVGAEVAPRVAAGKQPSAPTGGTVNLERDLGEGFGERKGASAESDRDRFRLGVDVAGGESGDAGDGLGVEQDEASRETVSRVKRGVREQAAQNLYAL
jgi:hypothetical protein